MCLLLNNNFFNNRYIYLLGLILLLFNHDPYWSTLVYSIKINLYTCTLIHAECSKCMDIANMFRDIIWILGHFVFIIILISLLYIVHKILSELTSAWSVRYIIYFINQEFCIMCIILFNSLCYCPEIQNFNIALYRILLLKLLWIWSVKDKIINRKCG